MAKKLSGKYYLKNTSNGSYSDVTTLYDGVNILSIEGIDALGKSINTYVEQWMSGGVDFLITSNNGVIVREMVDIKVVFVVGQRYATTVGIDPQTVYDNFVSYMTNTDIWIKDTYVGKQVHCVCIDGVEPQSIKLKRGNDSYLLGSISLHCLEKPTAYQS